MLRKNAILVGALSGSISATPVLAVGNDCLQPNQMTSWRAIDERTLVFMDLRMRMYTAEMKDRCFGATHGDASLVFRTWEDLACLMPGLIIDVVAPGIMSTCAIGALHAGSLSVPTHEPDLVHALNVG
jgi:hypothetical protein